MMQNPRACVLILVLLVAGAASADQPRPAPDATELTLEEATQAALNASGEARRARLAVSVARAELAGRDAAFGPTVTAEGGLAYIGNPPEGVTIETGALGTAPDPSSTFPQPVPEHPFEIVPDAENLGISVSVRLEQTLFSWGKLQSARAAAQEEVLARSASLELTEREIRSRVGESYIALAVAEASLPLVTEIVDLLERRVADRELEFEEGTVTRSDVLSERAILAGGRTQLVRADQGVASARAALAYLTGVTSPSVTLPDPPGGIPDESELVARALGNYPELSELAARLRQAEIQVDVAESSRPFLPDIGLTVTVDAQGQRVPLIQANWSDLWDTNLQISVGARMLLYDHGANAATLDAAVAQAAQAESGVTELGDALPLLIRESVARFRVAEATLAEAQARLADAEEQDRNAEISFENELISRRDRLGAALQRKEAELSRLIAIQSLWQAFFALEELAGQLP